VSGDGEERRDRLGELVKKHFKPASPPAANASKKLSVNGHHNVVVMRGAKIVIASPAAAPPAHINGNGNGKKKKTTWHAELEGLIWQRVWDLGMTSEQFYELAEKQLRRTQMSSLAKISERDLGVLYEMMATMRRPALE
jgi:hypothetical protein